MSKDKKQKKGKKDRKGNSTVVAETSIAAISSLMADIEGSINFDKVREHYRLLQRRQEEIEAESERVQDALQQYRNLALVFGQKLTPAG